MAQVANNADDYAAARQNIFFSGITPDLDGQCVSLVKWFMQEMSDVPNPQAARGDARYVGKTLVSQGLAVEVAYADRRRGDIVCLEYGVYGHIYVQLSGGRVFEENVKWPGVASKIVDGATVYASRIGSDTEAWRHDMHVYRLLSYNEKGNNTMTPASQTPVDETAVRQAYDIGLLRDPTPQEIKARVDAGNKLQDMQSSIMASAEHKLVISDRNLGVKIRTLLGDSSVTPDTLEAALKAKYGGSAPAPSLPAGTYIKVDPASVVTVK